MRSEVKMRKEKGKQTTRIKLTVLDDVLHSLPDFELQIGNVFTNID